MLTFLFPYHTMLPTPDERVLWCKTTIAKSVVSGGRANCDSSKPVFKQKSLTNFYIILGQMRQHMQKQSRP